MTGTVFQSQLEDTEAFTALLDSAESLSRSAAAEGKHQGHLDLERASERLRKAKTSLENPDTTEAIVMLHGYPSLLIKNGDYETPINPVWKDRLEPFRPLVRHVIGNTGRIDLINHPDYKWVGTAWRVNETTFVTNRHVASIFSEARANGFRIRDNIKVHIDLAEEHDSDAVLEYLVGAIRHIEADHDDAVDMAILTLDEGAASIVGDPIELDTSNGSPEFIGVVGYPASDHRNPQDAMNRIFGGIFNVKRLAPGRVMDRAFSDRVFTHNCTTLGGNSGSVVFDLATGKAIGLHFAGNAQRQNYAVKAGAVEQVLRRSGIVLTPGGAGSDEDGAGADASFDTRDGYQPEFIGTGTLAVPLPQLNPVQRRYLARSEDGSEVLHYRHFSVVMNGPRRLAFVAAVNIDGGELRRPARTKRFRLDPRLAEDLQAGEALYKHNDLDRGHLVRRLDPCWGDKAMAEEANRDSFYFPNIAPQHKDLNQRIWLEIEDHILDTTDERDARVSVFVGCLFADDDPRHQSTGIAVPMGFWKVVASVARRRCGRAVVRELQAQAFLLWQDHLVAPSDLEIVFGAQFATHQVTVEELERLTGLDFGPLRDADTFALPPETRERLARESIKDRGATTSAESMQPLRSLDDIVL